MNRDITLKTIFAHKEVMAQVLRFYVPEYKNMSTDEVILCLETPSEDTMVDDTSSMIDLKDGEQHSLSDKLIRYDLYFVAKNPKVTSKHLGINLQFDVEFQSDYYPSNPSYDIVNRAMYYSSRLLSRQLGVLTSMTNYDCLEKVYSIWICSDIIPRKLENKVEFYKTFILNEDGSIQDAAPHDLINTIFIYVGDKKNNDEGMSFLQSILSGQVDNAEKICNIEFNQSIKDEVITLRTREEVKFELGKTQGIEIGKVQGIEIGTKHTVLKIVRTMLSLGKQDHEIMATLEISQEQLEILKSELKHQSN